MAISRGISLGDLTNLSVLAPIKPGLVRGFETISYLERLRRVLDSLHASRLNLRESELLRPLFPDSVGRWDIIQNFRYAIIPPYPAVDPDNPLSHWRLSLNVSFDGGWETYMRVIYRDIGPLLDLLFCHCQGYPGSRKASFADYCKWVRANEADGGIFYADSISVLDQRYLAGVEKLLRETGGDPEKADVAVAEYCLPGPLSTGAALAQIKGDQSLLALPLRTLKGLYRLSAFFPPDVQTDFGVPQAEILGRFSQLILKDFIGIMPKLMGDADLGQRFKDVGADLKDELAWLRVAFPDAADVPDPAFDAKQLQSRLLDVDDESTHGCVVLLRIKDAAKDSDRAAACLSKMARLCGATDQPDAIHHQLAFTAAGLRSLGISAHWLKNLPQEFVDGMEARCGVLGDVRGNHPDHWTRPLAYGQETSPVSVDLSAVHVVALVRLADANTSGDELHPRLIAEIAKWQAADSGLVVLSVQHTRRVPSPDTLPDASGHFGFVDGISQPVIKNVAANTDSARDQVMPGELLLGHRNARGDQPDLAATGDFLFNGSFLVMRKLRQRFDYLDHALSGYGKGKHEEILARMMGRRRDGKLLFSVAGAADGNDFDYANAGAKCPYASHIRRANPRDGRGYMPRILRRGMSYGPLLAGGDPADDRGVMFIAYCSSIAEQFEVIQRWMAGGNSSSISSTQDDPLLGVPQPGEDRIFRYVDDAGSVIRINLGDKPFVQLEWGLYLFVPSLTVLNNLSNFRKQAAQTPSQPLPAAAIKDRRPAVLRERIEDLDRPDELWRRVREAHHGTLDDKLIGGANEVLAALKDDGNKLSVCGYATRMGQSIGINLLGLDGSAHSTEAALVKPAIEAIGELKAFNAALGIANLQLEQVRLVLPSVKDRQERSPIDLIAYSEAVLAKLCNHWIGLPEVDVPNGTSPNMEIGGQIQGNPQPPRCPGNFISASRYIFSISPTLAPAVVEAGQIQGEAALTAVWKWFESNGIRGALAKAVAKKMTEEASFDKDLYVRTIAGIILGFAPTLHGNFIRTMKTMIDDGSLWTLQNQLMSLSPKGKITFKFVKSALRPALIAAMRQHPVPAMVWRSPVMDSKVNLDDDRRVVIGLGSALTDPDMPEGLLFGRDDREGKPPTVHGCPGHKMAIGVLLAMLAGLMSAGNLRPTGSPVLLILSRKRRGAG